MDNETKMMLNAILEEMGRMGSRIDQRFDKIDFQLESMRHEVNACKLEKESVSLLLKKINQLKRDSGLYRSPVILPAVLRLVLRGCSFPL